MPCVLQRRHRDTLLLGLGDTDVHGLRAHRLPETEAAVDDRQHVVFLFDHRVPVGKHDTVSQILYIARGTNDAVTVMATKVGPD